MSSTNVHSREDKHIVGGSINFTPNEKEPVNMRQFNEKGEPLAGKGPSIIEVKEGPNAVISAQNNIVVKEGSTVIGRATEKGNVLSGDPIKVEQALSQKAQTGMDR